jgi:hypothetical protein
MNSCKKEKEKVPASTTGTSKYLLILDMYCNKAFIMNILKR